ncbi:CsgG/HfaB family protein [Persephonella sp. KM09-Lau-8]|uniref:CsgG/HfaB family protein n=1 Tax=Persephonella sp. KM09-Lau-8 TaxID=1158345 RepID=UPI0009DCBF73|nr:CsgG/HfaB family protein [Persephonella sp. KM09-Lau-8]
MMINLIKKISFLTLFIGLVTYLTGCAGVSTTSIQTTEQNLNEAVKYEGPKARIAVAKFKCKAAKCGGRIGEGIRDMLVDALVKTGKFIVLERGEGLGAIKEELELGQSGLVQPGKAPQPGLLEGADILVVGSIVAFEPNAGGIKGGIGGLVPKIPILGGIKLGKEDAYIAVVLRLIDVRTGRIINSTRVEGKASSFSVGGLGGGLLGTIPLGGGLEVYKNTPMEKAVMVLLDNAVKAIEKYVPESYYRYNSKGLPVKPTAQTTGAAAAGAGAVAGTAATQATQKPVANLKLIFSDDFESYGIGQKTPLTKWNGTAEATVRLKPQINKNLGKILDFHDLHNFICAKIPKQKDFVVILLRKNNGYHDANLFFRINEKVGYKLRMRGERYYIRKVSGNDEVEIADNGGGKAYNDWYKTKLVVNGNNIKVYDGNKLILDINDNDQFLNKAGDICINGEAWFDNIKIYKIEK